ncbi:MAG: alpha-1,6-glucosidase domain-containing protein [Aestuariibacter sp.]
MVHRKRLWWQSWGVAISSLVLLGCFSPDGLELPEPVDAGTLPEPAPPALSCDAPEVLNDTEDACELPPPSVTPEENEAVIYYNREDAEYEGWVLHLWNNEQCPDTVAEPTNWPEGPTVSGIDPVYGGYFIVPLLPDHSDCMNFIVHDADGNKDISQQDLKMDLSGERIAWTLSGVESVFDVAIVEVPITVSDRAVHWVAADTLVWGEDTTQFADMRLYYSQTADLAFDSEAGIDSGNYYTLTTIATQDSEQAQALNQSSWDALQIDADVSQVKEALKGQLIVVAYDDQQKPLAATKVQTARVLDAIYTAGENDADEADYGPVYSANGIELSLWAPTAQMVALNLYDADKTLLTRQEMALDSETGIWQTALESASDRLYYRFEVTVYHPSADDVVTVAVTDPYSVSVSTNGRYSQLVNLQDDDLKPVGWDDHSVPEVAAFEDLVIYEGHVRDFSALDETVSEANRGRYLAYTESNSLPVAHLQSLVDAGLNMYHLLPLNDIASINEDQSETINLFNTVAEACALDSNLPVCGVEDDNSRLLAVFESYDPASEDAQALTNALRNIDQFNWGYDPHHFNVPDGAYASDPEGTQRILETRAMVKALHDLGLRVALDVVFNHTNASGLNDNSVLDKVVPGYYHRYSQTTGQIERSTCCENTATENRMMAKLMQDSLTLWSAVYGFDAFRFDLMGHIPKAEILASFEAVKAVDPDTYFYGEGWDFGEVAGDRLFEQATQKNMAGTEVGTFNDQIREAVRGGALFSGDSSQGTLRVQDKIRMSLAGTLTDFQFLSSNNAFISADSLGGYAHDPADIINYVSKHDNETLWDQFNYSLPDDITVLERVRIQNMAMGITLLSQGIPFLQQGGDLLRSKSMDRNTYDAGDWFNRVDFSKMHNNWNVGIPLASENSGRWDEMRPLLADSNRAVSASDIQFAGQVFKEFLQLRQSSPLFRLQSAQDISDRIGFHNVGSEQQGGLVVMSIDDGEGLVDLDANVDAIVVVVNGTANEVSHGIPSASEFVLHQLQQNSVDNNVAQASFTANSDTGTFSVPAYSLAVFVKTQAGSQGTGLSPYATIGNPDFATYGDTAVYIRGSMNDWGLSNEMSYEGQGIYQTRMSLEAGIEYAFKFASEDWSTVNFGAGSAGEVVTAGEMLDLGNGSDLRFTPDSSEAYLFTIDASNAEQPVLTVNVEEPFPGTTVLLRGSMNGWGESDAFVYEGEGVYSIALDLEVGNYEFKVASNDWETVNFGANDAISEGSQIGLESGAGNINLSIAEQATYVFTLYAGDSENVSLSLFKGGMYGNTDIFIRGTMNDWAASEPMTFDGVKRYSYELELQPGDYEFKVADANWSTVDFGAGTDGNQVNLGERLILGAVGGDLSLSIATAGTYEFALLGPDKDNPVILVNLK